MPQVLSCKLAGKKELFEQFIRKIPPTADLFPVLRLIFPDSDSTRGAYGLKEQALARVFADLLFLPPQEKERLLNWRDPNLQAKHNCTVGDFPSVLLSVVEPRMSSNPSHNQLSVREVNKFLDDLYSAIDNETRRELFRDVLYKAKPMEVKWLIKMVLKDMKLGVGVESILRHLHPNAVQLYHISNSLKQVLSSISSSPKGQQETSPAAPPQSVFFQPFKPMLSEKVNPGDIPEKFGGMRGKVFLEPKIDGERMLVHADKQKGTVVIYSRNGVNFTKRYGDRQLSPLVLEGFKGLGAVFDGEMVAWDPEKERIHPFGVSRQVGESAAHSRAESDNEDQNYSLAVTQNGNMFYIVFDLVFYIDIDGRQHDLRNTSLEDRRDLLGRILLPVPHRFEQIHFQVLDSPDVDEIKRYLKQALDRKEEGLVIKKGLSEYKLSVRGSGWFKIKADYDKEFSDTLDLVVLGGYFSDSATEAAAESSNPLDAVTSFLVGVPKNETRIFKTVCKVGAGLTRTQLVYLRNQLRESVVPPSTAESNGLPEWFGGWKPSKPNRPDIVFSPWNLNSSVVLEIMAAEILFTNEFSSGYQLRFPRILKPRTDKDWTDATTFDQLRDMATTDVEKNRVFIQDLSRFERGATAARSSSDREPKKRKKEIVVIKRQNSTQ